MIISYPSLKIATTQAFDFVKQYVDDEKFDLRTAIAEDLSFWELDGYTFLEEFEKRFGLRLPDTAYSYVCPPELKGSLASRLIRAFATLIVLIPFCFIYPFLSEQQETTKERIKRNSTRLTLGDLAASVAVGYFIKRESIRIELPSQANCVPLNRPKSV